MTRIQRLKLKDYDELIASIEQKEAKLQQRRLELKQQREALLAELAGDQAQTGRAA